MMCYRDRWWCEVYKDCKNAPECSRPFTKEHQDAAEQWWGGPGAPVDLKMTKDGCWEADDDY